MITPWMIAVHEASHAVAALANGFRVRVLTIDAAVAEALSHDKSFAKSENGGGLCDLWSYEDDPGEHDQIVFALAGHEGVEEICNVPMNAFILDHDNTQARKLAERLGTDVALYRESARRLVRAHREVIERLAAELLLRQTLNERQIEECFYDQV